MLKVNHASNLWQAKFHECFQHRRTTESFRFARWPMVSLAETLSKNLCRLKAPHSVALTDISPLYSVSAPLRLCVGKARVNAKTLRRQVAQPDLS